MKSEVLVSAIVLSCVFFAPRASAATIISTSGTNCCGFLLGAEGNSNVDILYASWTTLSAYSNVSVSAEVGTGGASNPSLSAYLTTAVGPAETAADQIASTTITPGSGDEVDTLFSGLDLGAGTYYLVLTGGDTGSNYSDWWGTGATTVATTAAGVTFDGDGGAFPGAGTPDAGNPPASSFVSANDGLMFHVTGDAATATPEPRSITFMLAAGLAGLGLWKRRRPV